jgi:Fur family ferric uptake transcriptional regulator
MSKSHKHSTLSGVLAQMKSAKLKRTKPREAILKYLVENHGPFSAKEIQEALKRKEFDAVTTYRCLASFEEVGLVRRCDFGDGTARFEIRAEDDHHHHHVICTGCRKIEKLEDCHLEELEEKVKKLGYSKVRHVLEFSGLCRSCQKKPA